MLNLRKLVPVFSFCSVFGMLGCGNLDGAVTPAPTGPVMDALWGVGGEQDEQQGQQDQSGATQDANTAQCDSIHAELVTERAALQATPEWQALAATSEYAAVDATSQQLQTACAGHDATHPPSAQCVATFTQFKADLAAMKATPQWAGVETTPAYTLLKNTYDAYHAAGCGHFPATGDGSL